mgnify:FL=1
MGDSFAGLKTQLTQLQRENFELAIKLQKQE